MAKKELWEMCNPVGRPRRFTSPKKMWEECCGYFQWVKENPLLEDKAYCSQGDIQHTDIFKMRIMTISGLCCYLNIGETCWIDYRKNPKFSWVTKQVDAIIRRQKLEGAAAGLLNPLIVAREIGLREDSHIAEEAHDPDEEFL